MHELAFGITSANAAFGAVANPHDPTHFAGGSSGGTAAAIAAGLIPAGLGTDTGGSVRIPAALTGIAGFRPTPGRYPSEAVTPISKTRDTVGTLAATVDGLILLDEVITGQSMPDTAPEPREIRLGLVKDYYYANLETATEAVVDAALEQLREAGVSVIEVPYPELSGLVGAGFPVALYEARRDLTAYLQRYAPGVSLEQLAAGIASPDVRGIFTAVRGAGAVSEAAYLAALQDLQAMRVGFRELFARDRLDALVFPTTLLTARPIQGSAETVELNGQQVPTFATYIRNTDPASLAGLPALSFPIGKAANGLPVGLEIDGPANRDQQILVMARVLQEVLTERGD